MSEPVSPTPRGWYTDPQDSTKDRWWDGEFWTSYVHRAASARRSMFGAGYARMWWPGPNRAAGRSLLLARIAIGVLVLAFLIAVLIGASSNSRPGFAAALTVASLLVIAAVVSVAGIVFGILGVRGSARWGATLVAVWGLCASAVAASISLPITVVLVVGLVGG